MGTGELLGRSLKDVQGGEGTREYREEGGRGGGEGIVSYFRENSNASTRILLTKPELSNEMKLYSIIVYLDLARP